jgi:hypothetical protein
MCDSFSSLSTEAYYKLKVLIPSLLFAFVFPFDFLLLVGIVNRNRSLCFIVNKIQFLLASFTDAIT